MASSICSASSAESAPSCWKTSSRAPRTLAGISLALLRGREEPSSVTQPTEREGTQNCRWLQCLDSPCNVKAGILVGNEFPQQLAGVPEPVLHVHLLLLEHHREAEEVGKLIRNTGKHAIIPVDSSFYRGPCSKASVSRPGPERRQ